jgi:hypothetical protein
MEGDCTGSQGPQRTAVLEEKGEEEEENNNKKRKTYSVLLIHFIY